MILLLIRAMRHTMVAQNKRYISTIYTVIRNGNFSAKTLFDDIMLRNTYAAYAWTS